MYERRNWNSNNRLEMLRGLCGFFVLVRHSFMGLGIDDVMLWFEDWEVIFGTLWKLVGC